MSYEASTCRNCGGHIELRPWYGVGERRYHEWAHVTSSGCRERMRRQCPGQPANSEEFTLAEPST